MAVVAAHLIVGAVEEPFLPSMLASLEGVADVLLVNDNGVDPEGPNVSALRSSAFGRSARLILDRAPLVSFADARNRVLELHRRHVGTGWIAFVDADEVHYPIASTIAKNLDRMPSTIASVDGYVRHFLQSFHWYMEIARRRSFIRYTPELRWERDLHEQLAGINGRALAIPYAYENYGYLVSPERLAEKGRRYVALGQRGATVPEGAPVDAYSLLAPYWPRALRFHGLHPPAVEALRAELQHRNADQYALADEAVRRFQPPPVRLRNVVRRLNFEWRWRVRAFDPLARRLLEPT